MRGRNWKYIDWSLNDNYYFKILICLIVLTNQETDQQYLLQLYLRDWETQRCGWAAGDPGIHHQRVRSPTQGGAQDLPSQGI